MVLPVCRRCVFEMDTTRPGVAVSSELSKRECLIVRSSISPTKFAAKISRSQISSISAPSSFFWRSFLFSFSFAVSGLATSPIELLELAFPSVPSRSAGRNLTSSCFCYLVLPQKFHTDDVNHCYITNLVVMGFQMQLCSILRFCWSILDKCLCSFENSLQQSSNASFREEYIPQVLTVLL